jgi:hypothetical protein
MTDNRKAGFALIAGSVGAAVTMAIHPTAGGPMTPAQVDTLALTSGIAHSLAIISMLALFIGSCGLSRYIARPDRIAFTGLVLFGFSTIAALIATSVSGFIVPNLIRLMAKDAGANTVEWRIAISSMFQVNQAFAAIFSVAAIAAIVLWSASALRHRELSRPLAIYGCIVPPVLALLIIAGYLKLDVHGMAIVALAVALWFVGAGANLLRAETLPQASA